MIVPDLSVDIMLKKICAIYTRVLQSFCLHKIAHFLVQKRRKMSLHFIIVGCMITQDVVSWIDNERNIKGLAVAGRNLLRQSLCCT